jgi:hypothetical protein
MTHDPVKLLERIRDLEGEREATLTGMRKSAEHWQQKLAAEVARRDEDTCRHVAAMARVTGAGSAMREAATATLLHARIGSLRDEHLEKLRVAILAYDDALATDTPAECPHVGTHGGVVEKLDAEYRRISNLPAPDKELALVYAGRLQGLAWAAGLLHATIGMPLVVSCLSCGGHGEVYEGDPGNWKTCPECGRQDEENP